MGQAGHQGEKVGEESSWTWVKGSVCRDGGKTGTAVTLSSTGCLRRVPAGASLLLQGPPSLPPMKGTAGPANPKVVPRFLSRFYFFHQSRNMVRVGSPYLLVCL